MPSCLKPIPNGYKHPCLERHSNLQTTVAIRSALPFGHRPANKSQGESIYLLEASSNWRGIQYEYGKLKILKSVSIDISRDIHRNQFISIELYWSLWVIFSRVRSLVASFELPPVYSGNVKGKSVVSRSLLSGMSVLEERYKIRGNYTF